MKCGHPRPGFRHAWASARVFCGLTRLAPALPLLLWLVASCPASSATVTFTAAGTLDPRVVTVNVQVGQPELHAGPVAGATLKR